MVGGEGVNKEKGAGCLAYQDFDVGILLELGDGGVLLVPCEVAEVVQEGDLLFVEHAADDAGQFDPVDKDFGTGLAGIGEGVLTAAPTDDFVFRGFLLPQQDLVLDGDRLGAGSQWFLGVGLVVLLHPFGTVLHSGLGQVVVVANFPIRLGFVPLPSPAFRAACLTVAFLVRRLIRPVEGAQLPDYCTASRAAGLHFQFPSNAISAKRVSALENSQVSSWAESVCCAEALTSVILGSTGIS